MIQYCDVCNTLYFILFNMLKSVKISGINAVKKVDAFLTSKHNQHTAKKPTNCKSTDIYGWNIPYSKKLYTHGVKTFKKRNPPKQVSYKDWSNQVQLSKIPKPVQLNNVVCVPKKRLIYRVQYRKFSAFSAFSTLSENVFVCGIALSGIVSILYFTIFFTCLLGIFTYESWLE